MSDASLVLSDPSGVPDLLADPKFYMEQTLGRAIMWLAEVEKVEDVVASKALASAYEVFIREKELGHDAQLAATEIVRRCERRIGQLVRQGQERGEIVKKGDVVTDGHVPRWEEASVLVGRVIPAPRGSSPSEWVEYLLTCPDPMAAYQQVEERRMQHDLLWYLLSALYPERMSERCSAAVDSVFARWCT